MIKEKLPLINLEGYTFNCLRCGKCCKVVVKTEVSKKKYLYDYQGKLTNSPFTTTTVYIMKKKRSQIMLIKIQRLPKNF